MQSIDIAPLTDKLTELKHEIIQKVIKQLASLPEGHVLLFRDNAADYVAGLGDLEGNKFCSHGFDPVLINNWDFEHRDEILGIHPTGLIVEVAFQDQIQIKEPDELTPSDLLVVLYRIQTYSTPVLCSDTHFGLD